MVTVDRTKKRVDRSSSNLLNLLETSRAGWLKRCNEGKVLYWQGDPAEWVFLIRKGKVKVYSISAEGKAHTYEVLGAGSLVGVAALLPDERYESMARTLEETEVYVIPRLKFEHMLASKPRVCKAVSRQLAKAVRSLACEVRELSFLDVRRRLERRLGRLAEQHGIVNPDGIRLEMDITHEEIAELVAADRSTITTYLSELKRQGYLWNEGHRLVIMPPEHVEILDALGRSVVEGDEQEAISWARKVVEERVDPIKALDALIGGMRQVDKGFVREVLALPDVVLAAFAMKSAMPIIREEIKRTGKKVGPLGTVVIGTVYGDIHDIGKTLVSMVLTAEGFRVTDLGVNVTAEQFKRAVWQRRPDILAMSGLMTTTAREQRKVIQILKEERLRDKVKIMIGGGAITRELAETMGADGYEPRAGRASRLAKRLVGAGQGIQ
jgi:5-methyltetrahydrofolate--homocysteine methyltransferase